MGFNDLSLTLRSVIVHWLEAGEYLRFACRRDTATSSRQKAAVGQRPKVQQG